MGRHWNLLNSNGDLYASQILAFCFLSVIIIIIIIIIRLSYKY